MLTKNDENCLKKLAVVLCMKEYLSKHKDRKRVPKYELEAILDGYGLDYEACIQEGLDAGVIASSDYRGPGYKLA